MFGMVFPSHGENWSLMKKNLLLLSLLSAFVMFWLISCSKDQSSKTTTVKVRLTDNPVNADEVNVDIQQVWGKVRG